jgi:uncharacterized protein YheU (UPF0270 family)
MKDISRVMCCLKKSDRKQAVTDDKHPAANDDLAESLVEVPHTALAEDLLRAVIESFVLREGTDYGERELSLDDKVGRVVRLLERGDARIVFDPRTESVDVVAKDRRV